jgi:predicted phage terminase large subunit-like protein
MREQLGTTSYMAQYQQVTQDAQGGIIKKSWIKELATADKPCTYFLDSAYGGINADDNAIIGVYKEQNNLIIQMCEINKYEFPELIKWLKQNLPVNAKIYIEGKASGKSIIQTLRQQTQFNIVETQPKGSKLERKNAASPYFESGRVIVNQYINYKNEMIEQLIFDNTKHDDILDVITNAVETILKVNKGQYNII